MICLSVHTLLTIPVVFVVSCSGHTRRVLGMVYAICELDIGLPWPSKRLLLPLSFPSLFPSRRILRSETGAAGCRLYHSGHTTVHTKQTGALSMQAALVTLSPIASSRQIHLCSPMSCHYYLHPSSASPVVWRSGMPCTVPPLHAPVCQTRVLCVGTD